MTPSSAPDAVARIAEQWREHLPELDLEPMLVFGRIHRLSQLTAERIEAAYQTHGVGRAEFDVLSSLRRSGEPYTLAPKQISASLMLSSGGLTGRLDKLERAGLIERLPDPGDRRALRIRLTETGRTVTEAAVRAGLDVQRELLEPLSPEERDTLTALLRKLHSAYATTRY